MSLTPELLNRRCAYVYKNGKNSGNRCWRKITLKDKEHDYTLCSQHYYNVSDKRYNKKMESMLEELLDDEEEEKERQRDEEKLNEDIKNKREELNTLMEKFKEINERMSSHFEEMKSQLEEFNELFNHSVRSNEHEQDFS